jgi:hypothetical protein
MPREINNIIKNGLESQAVDHLQSTKAGLFGTTIYKLFWCDVYTQSQQKKIKN